MAAIMDGAKLGGPGAACAMLTGVISQTVMRICDENWWIITGPFDGEVPDYVPKPLPPFVKALREFRAANQVLQAEMQLAGKIPFPKPPQK